MLVRYRFAYRENFASRDGAVVDRRYETECGKLERRQAGRNVVGGREWTDVVHEENAVGDRRQNNCHRISRCKHHKSGP